jgi:ubiquinone/menaquinone biosynthesis C-methylase UbiE
LSIDEIRHEVENQKTMVFGCIANNESLPFKDVTFDCYLAPLSLHVMNDYKRMLSESFRVCKPGAKCGFSLWGRKENIVIYPLLERVMEKHGLGPATKPVKTNYDLAHRHIELRQELIDMGFVDVKIWFQPVNFVFNTFDDFF